MVKRLGVFFLAALIACVFSAKGFSQTKSGLLDELNQTKEKYVRAIDSLDVQNRLLRRQCDKEKREFYNKTEAQKQELREGYGYHFLDGFMEEKAAYRKQIKDLDMSNRKLTQDLDDKMTAAYRESEAQKKVLRKEWHAKRLELEAALAELENPNKGNFAAGMSNN